MITSLAYLFFDAYGEFVALPGIVMELYLIGTVGFPVSRGCYYQLVPVVDQHLYNGILYGILIFRYCQVNVKKK
jgi:hypothetical protein